MSHLKKMAGFLFTETEGELGRRAPALLWAVNTNGQREHIPTAWLCTWELLSGH